MINYTPKVFISYCPQPEENLIRTQQLTERLTRDGVYVVIDEFISNNTRRLNLEETMEKIASLEYIQEELNRALTVA